MCWGCAPCFFHVRAGDYQHGVVTDSERMQLTYGNADFDNERVPCTERQADLYKTHVSYNIADNGFTKIEQQDFSIKVEKEMNL